MKTNLIIAAAIMILAAIMSFAIFSNNGKAGSTGSPGENDCTNCHSGTVNTGPGSITIAATPSVANGYIPNTIYTVDVTVAENVSPNNGLFGFGIEALFASGANGGSLAITNSTITQIKTKTINSNVRNNVVHTGNGNTGPDSQTFSFTWTAPPSGSGTVTLYAAGNAADNDGGTSGDHIYKTSLSIPELTTSVSEKTGFTHEFSIFPNPASDKLNIHYSMRQNSPVEIYLCDIKGGIPEILLSVEEPIGVYSSSFDLPEKFIPGIYLIIVKNGDYTGMKKIIIQ